MKDTEEKNGKQESKKHKVVVIGAGPGGYAAAFKAADLGMDVTLVDPAANPGGVCLYRGCIPSKALLHLVKIQEEALKAGQYGIQFAKPKIDLTKVRAWKESVVEKLTGGLGQLSKSRKVKYVKGTARFLSNSEIEIKSNNNRKSKIAYDNAIIAVGSTPATLPDVAIDHRYVIDSTDALKLEKIPKELLVIGGGYIGLELGSVYAALGANVSIAEMASGFLPGVDKNLVDVLYRETKSRYKELWFNTEISDIKVVNRKVEVAFSKDNKEQKKKYDQVLVAIGRRPNTQNLGLEKVGIALNEKGFIPVNMQRQTNKQHIYAIGDVTGEPMLAHKANREGIVAAEYIAGHKGAGYDPVSMPAVVFTNPEIAWCGLTEMEAKEKNKDYKVLKFPWSASGRAATMGTGNGLTKLLVEKDSGRVLGGGIVGKEAGSLITEIVLAMEMGSTVEDLALTIHPHPTLSETIMESAEMFFGKATHFG
ncbi:dihydrolipoyl dehydrogenase [Olivibacter sp. SDN3]|uniref:dihydrolipoyl dehydrogenase n=1 Tax=Olivibacter sp. SDN3 TaxID=2764720 RepID=UPI00165111D7|nr:dihydrolipoyl dehydrogenase [Olivibacter sp. SDN3]QNL49637.1 dihydrolipoyl dehydrogenase [Olivibacter sp. SDN3]